MKKVLIIIDPQNDFINGSLPVIGADEKMRSLSKYIDNNGEEYDYIFVTMDKHPINHCSFVENGGIWPSHCIEFTDGWRISSHLINSLLKKVNVTIYSKGTYADKEEYSILDNEDDGLELLNVLEEYDLTDGLEIHLCGIAGDVCVLETLKGLNKIFDNISVLKKYTASLDGGKKLKEYISKHSNLKLL